MSEKIFKPTTARNIIRWNMIQCAHKNKNRESVTRAPGVVSIFLQITLQPLQPELPEHFSLQMQYRCLLFFQKHTSGLNR